MLLSSRDVNYGCCNDFIWTGCYRLNDLFFFKINWFLILEPSCSPAADQAQLVS